VSPIVFSVCGGSECFAGSAKRANTTQPNDGASAKIG
jgi:hypothetical protein